MRNVGFALWAKIAGTDGLWRAVWWALWISAGIGTTDEDDDDDDDRKEC